MSANNNPKPPISILEKLIFSILVATSIALLFSAIFPAQAEFAWQVIKSPSQILDPDATPSGNYLRNGNMEGGFADDINGSNNKTANEWSIESGKGEMKVHYENEPFKTHSGAGCQKITIEDSPNFNEVQFIQTRYLPSGFYKGSVWMRADTPIPISITIYGGGHFYDKKLIRDQWQKVEFSGDVRNWGYCPFLISIKRAGTIYIDDAELHRESGGIAGIVLSFFEILAVVIGLVFIIRYLRRSESFKDFKKSFFSSPKWLSK